MCVLLQFKPCPGPIVLNRSLKNRLEEIRRVEEKHEGKTKPVAFNWNELNERNELGPPPRRVSISGSPIVISWARSNMS